LLAHDEELIVFNKLSIREVRNGVRTAIARVPLAPGLRLSWLKKLKVGWAVCRIKQLTSRHGCARCSSTEHETAISVTGCGVGFVRVRIGAVAFYSCYCTPNCSNDEFDTFLCGLEASIRNAQAASADIVVAGDFNAHFAEWGSASEDLRGALLSNFAAAIDLQVCNEGTTPTYHRVNASSVIDVTFARTRRREQPLVTDWTVLSEIDSASDYDYIEFMVNESRGSHHNPFRRPETASGWAVKKLSTEKLSKY
jgi:hypothetical protein